MDIFGQANKPKTPFQNELAAKIQERKAKGLAVDLSETDEALSSDDDLVIGYKATNKQNKPANTEQGKRNPVSEQNFRKGLYNMNESKTKKSQPKNELDRLLDDDDEDASNPEFLKTMKKPWTPPQFKDLTEEPRKPIPKERTKNPPEEKSVVPSDRKSPFSAGSNTDDELAFAYTKQLDEHTYVKSSNSTLKSTSSASPAHSLGRKTPMESHDFSERSTPQGKGVSSGKSTPKVKEDSSGRSTPKAKDDSSGRSTPKIKDEFSGKSTSKVKEDISGRTTPKVIGDFSGRTTPGFDNTFEINPKMLGKTKAENISPDLTDNFNSLPKRSDSTLKGEKTTTLDDIFGRKSPSQTNTFDSIFGKKNDNQLGGDAMGDKAKAASKLNAGQNELFDSIHGKKSPYLSSSFHEVGSEKKMHASSPSHYADSETREKERPEPALRKGSYIQSLLADSKPEEKSKIPKTSSPYLDSLLQDNTTDSKPHKQSKGFAEDIGERSISRENMIQRSRSLQRLSSEKSASPSPERESSVCEDYDRDPASIEKQKKEKEVKKKLQKEKAQTENQEVEITIEEVADAQDPLCVTFTAEKRNQSQIIKPTPVKPRYSKAADVASPKVSTISFEDADSIREYIYQEWKEKKDSITKQQRGEQSKIDKEQQDKKKKEENDKKVENVAAFKSWKETKDEILKKKLKEAKILEKQKKEEEKTLKDKKLQSTVLNDNSSQNFKKWKEAQDAKLKEAHEEERKKKERQLVEEQEMKKTKQKDADTAFKSWKKNKDEETKKVLHERKALEKTEGNQKLQETRRREREAEEQFEKWLVQKEKYEKREKKMARSRQLIDEESPRPPWSPSNKTIAYGR